MGTATEILIGVNDENPFPVVMVRLSDSGYPLHTTWRRQQKHQSIVGKYAWTRAPTTTVKNLGSIRTTDRLSFTKKYKKLGYVDS